MADPDRAIITLCDDINETVAVAGVDVKLGVALRHFREHGREVSRAERKRHSNSQATAKVTSG
jgi:deoxycytidine triphosphate deaminase